MGDPIDPLTAGGGGIVGAGVVGLLLRILQGQSFSDLKEALAEFKRETRETWAEHREEFRRHADEEAKMFRTIIERADERHSRAIEDMAGLTMKVNAYHQRLDTVEHAVREIERRLDREGR